MKYDITNHLPTQIELLLVSYQKGDLPGMQRSMENINTVIKDSKFKKNIQDYEGEKAQHIKKCFDKAVDAYKTLSTAKNPDELFIDIQEIQNDLQQTLATIEHEYWEAIKEYVTLYIDKLPEPDKTEPE